MGLFCSSGFDERGAQEARTVKMRAKWRKKRMRRLKRKRRKMRARSKYAHPHLLCHGGPSSWCKTRLLDGCSGYRLGPQWSPTSLPVIPACQTVGIIFSTEQRGSHRWKPGRSFLALNKRQIKYDLLKIQLHVGPMSRLTLPRNKSFQYLHLK